MEIVFNHARNAMSFRSVALDNAGKIEVLYFISYRFNSRSIGLKYDPSRGEEEGRVGNALGENQARCFDDIYRRSSRVYRTAKFPIMQE